jgi:DNA-binding CsgD family transcriptional regulator
VGPNVSAVTSCSGGRIICVPVISEFFVTILNSVENGHLVAEELMGPCDKCGYFAPTISNLEHAIIAELAKGLQTKEIANKVKRSKPTIEGYIRTLFLKFGARTRAHLVAAAYENGTLAPHHHR